MLKNVLEKDPSPYLQQHKDNPVNWQVWSEEILLIAKKEKKPIILSIGYASCHWCHVMAHESFEDQETAKIMNDNFINIRVDREERPDIDFVFQSSFQLFNKSNGGWPLTMFLDENSVPFMAGTYFPKNEQHGIPSFKNVLKKVSEIYSNQRELITKQSSIILKSLELKKNPVIKQDLEPILDNILNNLDKKNGGYQGSPKFPIFNVYDTLIYFYNKTKDKKYLDPVKTILTKLSAEGIYDHVEGGISRYTVDENWLIPHFEKMLYDNSQFVMLLSKYLKIKPDKYFIDKTIQTIDFINSNFINKNEGLMGSAYDADSDGEEGKYYVFSYNELKEIKEIEKFFDVQKEGNWEGKIILKEKSPPPKEILLALKNLRKNRTKPFFDNKTQLDLNCIWLSALICAHKSLPDKGYLKMAINIYNNLEKKFLNQHLFHSNSKSIVFLEDYAYAISMLIDLYDVTLNIKYKLKAKEICSEAIKKFYVKDKAIFQKNEIKTNNLFCNPIDISDHNIPNGNSIMLLNFSRLGFRNEGKELSNSLNSYLNTYKLFMTSSLKAIDFFNAIELGKNCNEEGCLI